MIVLWLLLGFWALYYTAREIQAGNKRDGI